MYIILIMALLAVVRTNISHRRIIKKLHAEALSNTQITIQNQELISSNNYLSQCKSDLIIENKHLLNQNLQLGFVNLNLCNKLHTFQNQQFRYYKPKKEISPISFN